jgi:hypothetical protein
MHCREIRLSFEFESSELKSGRGGNPPGPGFGAKGDHVLRGRYSSLNSRDYEWEAFRERLRHWCRGGSPDRPMRRPHACSSLKQMVEDGVVC